MAKACKISKYYYKDNFILIGDAAHPFRPIGQGINLAMLDGMNLQLAIDCIYPNDRESALKHFSDHTKPEGDACIDLALSFDTLAQKVNDIMMTFLGVYV